MYRRDVEYVKQATSRALDLFPAAGSTQRSGCQSVGRHPADVDAGDGVHREAEGLMIDELSQTVAPLVVEKLLEVVRGSNVRG
jgi:ABC-type branched-subunit amino acid transport system ATPase component